VIYDDGRATRVRAGDLAGTLRRGAGAERHEEAICKDPAVFFCENFEDWGLGPVYNNPGNRAKYKGNPWGANPGTPDIVNTEHFDGSKSLRMTTPANQASGGAVDTS
jgi:hypothetical protein